MNTQAQNSEERAPKLLNQVRNLMRLQHYSIHTERSFVDWSRRFVRFHHMETRADLENAEPKIEASLTDDLYPCSPTGWPGCAEPIG
jgi:hypothetical protein